MNRIFKTVFSRARNAYVVANEKSALRGKPAKTALAVTLALSVMAGSACAWGTHGKINDPQSWQSQEYRMDWGLEAMNAAEAYALGYTGQNVQLGVMDSGVLSSHQEFDRNRITVTSVSGEYGSEGNRYPQSVKEGNEGLPYHKGQAYSLTGEFVDGLNDSHGTHCTGTIAAARDGHEMHGVAFDAKVVVGNTGATDDNNYGPFQDYAYFYEGWKALVQAGAKVINNSWGTNTRVFKRYELNENGSVKKVNGEPVVYTGSYKDHLAVDTEAQMQYEYFLFKKMYAGQDDFVKAARDAVKGHDSVQIFTTGNRNFANPYFRPAYPYYQPDIEDQWIAVAGLEQVWEYEKDKDGNDLKVELKDQKGNKIGTQATVTKRQGSRYRLVDNWNEAGVAKWWTITAPGKFVYSTLAKKDHGGKFVFTDKADPFANPKATTHNSGYLTQTATDDYGIKSGTSMAAPHVTGAMGVILSRFPEMTASQARTVMFTTAQHEGIEGWTNTDGTEPAAGEVSDRMGWGVPDLKSAMFGPRQLLGEFNYTLNGEDIWENDISQVAMDQRRREEAAWMQLTRNGTKLSAFPYELGEGAEVKLGGTMSSDRIKLSDAKRWRAEFFKTRAAAIQARQYDGVLVKSGSGTLTLCGTNTYRGGTTVAQGTLVALPQSLGLGTVTVKNGATLEVADQIDQGLKSGKKAVKAQANAALRIVAEHGATIVLHNDADRALVQVAPNAVATIIVK